MCNHFHPNNGLSKLIHLHNVVKDNATIAGAFGPGVRWDKTVQLLLPTHISATPDLCHPVSPSSLTGGLVPVCVSRARGWWHVTCSAPGGQQGQHPCACLTAPQPQTCLSWSSPAVLRARCLCGIWGGSGKRVYPSSALRLSLCKLQTERAAGAIP